MIWAPESNGNQTKPPLLIDGYFYAQYGTNTRRDDMARMFSTQNWSPLALADGKLLMRDQSRLLCIKIAK
jgi:hypothetical protein